MDLQSSGMLQPGQVDFAKLFKLIADGSDIRDNIIVSEKAPGKEMGGISDISGIMGAEGAGGAGGADVLPFKSRTTSPPQELEEELAKRSGMVGKAGGMPPELEQLAEALATKTNLG